ncbi:MAG: isoleucine--tRNA ligase [bacterium]|nr:isoleucine--tRNA ligase [bacterium]
MKNAEQYFKQTAPKLTEIEKFVQEYWRSINVNRVVDRYRSGAPVYFFLDGPPFPSAATIHVGTARNKILKDVIIRYHILLGYNVFRSPGYDCHGLPVEVEVEKELGISSKKEIEEKLGKDEFIRRCRELVERNIAGMTKQFERLGVLFDWENTYRTMDKEYMEAVWKAFKSAYEQGLVVFEQFPVWWCPRCQTTLSDDYEVSEKYVEREDPSVFVKFPLVDEENTYLLIWTTTPWTLPANLAVAVHPDFEYAYVQVNGERWIVAKERISVLQELLGKKFQVEKVVKGKELEGKKYKFIFEDLVPCQRELEQRFPRVHTVILADFVSLEEGTGVVHCAPGHGKEDWFVCRQYGIPAFSPVDEEGRYTQEIPALAGTRVFEANEKIIELLKQRGLLVHAGKIIHRYPLCWRCKTPLIIRCVEEIVVLRSKFKEKLKEIVEKEVKIYPEEFKRYFLQLIDSMPDWAIARQRYWGTPIPLWKCPNGHVFVAGSAKEIEELAGKELHDLHIDVLDKLELRCPRCGAQLRRVPAIFDVWADSGAGVAALSRRAGKAVADVVIEGPDQFRGWFLSLLVQTFLAQGSKPYERIVAHGWVYDKYGRTMHKSERIGLLDEEAYERIGGADVLRYYILSKTKPWEELRYDEEELAQVRQFFTVLWNIYRFAAEYLRLDNFEPQHIYPVKLTLLDRLVLAKFAATAQRYKQAMDNFEFSQAIRELSNFVLEDLSRFYVRLSRDRAWEEASSAEKQAFYYSLYSMLRALCVLLAPFVPHLAEFLYQVFVRSFEPALETVQAEYFPWQYMLLFDERLLQLYEELRAVVEQLLRQRDEHKIKLRWPLRKATIYAGPRLFQEFSPAEINELKEIIARAANVKEVELVRQGEGNYIVKGELDTAIDRDLWLEALAREIIRRVQVMRKELDLPIDAVIELKIWTEDKDLQEAVNKFSDMIARETRAKSLELATEKIEGKEWTIEGKKIVFAVKKS